MTARVACRADALGPEEALGVKIADDAGRDRPVVVARAADGPLHALADVCSHGQVALSDGEVEGRTIECWLHGSTFELTTGAPTCLPATAPVPVYPVTVRGDDVLVDVDAPR